MSSDAFEALGIETDLGDRLDPNGNELGDEYNPLSTGVLFEIDEIFLADVGDYENQYVLLDDDGSISSSDLLDSFSDSGAAYNSPRECAAADIDGDGRDEIMLSVGPYFYILDDGKIILKPYSMLPIIKSIQRTDNTIIRMDTADFDLDGSDEIVVAIGITNINFVGQYKILDYVSSGFGEMDCRGSSGNIQTTTTKLVGLSTADVACGDFDGDGLEEVAFGGVRYGQSEIKGDTLILNTTMDEKSDPVFTFYNADKTHGGVPDSWWLVGIAAGDLNGDGVDEIATYVDVYVLEVDSDAKSTGSLVDDAFGAADPLDDSYDDYPVHDFIQMGDVTGDQLADVVFLSQDWDQLFIYSYNDSKGNLVSQNIDWVNDDTYCPPLCLPNVDDDSFVLKFLRHELQFTKPDVLTLIASPPYIAGINEDIEGETNFGKISSVENSAESQNSISVSCSVGWEGYGVTSKVELGKSINWGSIYSSEYTEKWGYNCVVGEDLVVFTSIPQDVYVYEILSCSEDCDLEKGDTTDICIPRELRTYAVSVEYYNNHAIGETIDSSIFCHTKGDPFSYAD